MVEEANPSVVGRLRQPPRGIVLHGSRSGRTWSRAAEEAATRRYALAGADGLAWHVTIGDGGYALHLPASCWGWHAREHSLRYLGAEFAQARREEPVSAGQVRAFAAWVRAAVWPVWPGLDLRAPGALVTHADLPAGRRDGKDDPFPAGDERAVALVQRLRAALAGG